VQAGHTAKENPPPTTPPLTFVSLLDAISRRKSLRTAALYAHLVATRGAGTPPFVVNMAELTEESATRCAGTDLFTRVGPHWGAHRCVAVGLWELRFLGISRPALGPAGRPRCLVVWRGDLRVLPGPETRTARLRLSALPVGDTWPGAVLATF
jgi:hypothetical protein